MSIKSSEISVGKLRRAYKTKDLLNRSVFARGIEYGHPAQMNKHRLDPSQTGWYSIYLPRRDGRLS